MNKHTFFLFLAIIITSCSNAQGNSDIHRELHHLLGEGLRQ